MSEAPAGTREPAGRSPLDAPPILETVALTKQFGGLTAVNDVSFGVPERAIVSIIGPNGAGKTTFFNMLTASIARRSGSCASPAATSRARGPTASRRWGSRARSRTSGCSGR